MEESYIQSKQNDQVKNLVKLRERKHRDRQERFVVEGLRESLHETQDTPLKPSITARSYSHPLLTKKLLRKFGETEVHR